MLVWVTSFVLMRTGGGGWICCKSSYNMNYITPVNVDRQERSSVLASTCAHNAIFENASFDLTRASAGLPRRLTSLEKTMQPYQS